MECITCFEKTKCKITDDVILKGNCLKFLVVFGKYKKIKAK